MANEKKEYIVSLTISFITPIGVEAKSEKDAELQARKSFEKTWKKIEELMDDSAELEIDVDYIEEQ